MTWASKQRVGSPQRKAVLLTIANLSTPQGELLAQQSYISRVSEASERSVREHLAALEAMGLLTREHRRGRAGRHASDLIRLNMGEFAAESDDQDGAQTVSPAAGDAGRAAADAAGEPPRPAGDALTELAGNLAAFTMLEMQVIPPRCPREPWFDGYRFAGKSNRVLDGYERTAFAELAGKGMKPAELSVKFGLSIKQVYRMKDNLSRRCSKAE